MCSGFVSFLCVLSYDTFGSGTLMWALPGPVVLSPCRGLSRVAAGVVFRDRSFLCGLCDEDGYDATFVIPCFFEVIEPISTSEILLLQ